MGAIGEENGRTEELVVKGIWSNNDVFYRT
jgi:hypothetical protein